MTEPQHFDDPWWGVAGRYTVDPATGERRPVDKPLRPAQDPEPAEPAEPAAPATAVKGKRNA